MASNEDEPGSEGEEADDETPIRDGEFAVQCPACGIFIPEEATE